MLHQLGELAISPGITAHAAISSAVEYLGTKKIVSLVLLLF
jgi:hypothetical protein